MKTRETKTIRDKATKKDAEVVEFPTLYKKSDGCYYFTWSAGLLVGGQGDSDSQALVLSKRGALQGRRRVKRHRIEARAGTLVKRNPLTATVTSAGWVFEGGDHLAERSTERCGRLGGIIYSACSADLSGKDSTRPRHYTDAIKRME